ncbi:MAG: helix-turn-helix domain-containing protein, partial [Pseudomonadota bacterium]
SWPGNVRELENFVRRLMALYPQDTLNVDMVAQELEENAKVTAVQTEQDPKNLSELVEHYLSEHFAAYGTSLPPPGLHERIIRDVERPLLTAALAATRGNQIRAAELLGLNRNTLRSRIKSLDISVFKGPQS